MQLHMFESVEPYSLALFTRVLGWDNARVQALLAGVRADLRNLSYHIYSQMYVPEPPFPPLREGLSWAVVN